MNILYTNFHPRNGGGHVTYIINLLKGLAGHHVLTVATPASSRLYRYAAEIQGVKVVDMSFSTRASSWFAPRRKFHALLMANHFDVIHVNGSADHKLVMLALLGVRPRPRIVMTKHNEHPLSSLGHWLRARFATDRVIAVSEHVARQVRTSTYLKAGVVTIRHGVDTAVFSPVSLEEKLNLRNRLMGPGLESKILLGSAGGTDRSKGWLDLVAGIAMLPEEARQRFHVVVAGDLPDATKKQDVERLGMTDQVSFPGLVDDVRPILAACDIGFVLSYQEALSFACREMMSLGLPVLVTNAGGLPENLTDRSEGWIVPVRDPQAISTVLHEVLHDPAQISTMGERARQKALAEFGLERFVNATLDVYRDTIH